MVPPFGIDYVDLNISLDPALTKVRGRISPRPNPASTSPHRLTIAGVPQAPFVFEAKPACNPKPNTEISGLYRSGEEPPRRKLQGVLEEAELSRDVHEIISRILMAA